MAVASYPIHASDFTDNSTPDSPVSVEVAKSTRHDQPLAYGWVTGEEVQPGFSVFVARYESLETYNVVNAIPPGFGFSLNLGDMQRAGFAGHELYLPSGTFGTISSDEPVPVTAHRAARKQQMRCGFALHADWIKSGMFETFDRSKSIAEKLARFGPPETGVASPAMLAAANRLFAAFDLEGPLARLHREAAASAFLAEAFADPGTMRQPHSVSRSDAARIIRVKEMLDSLAPDVDLRLADLAECHGMSIRSMTRHFRLMFGTTIFAYVAARRMEKASVALEDGVSIDQAAYIAGFAHTTNFSSAFRNRYGHPPGKRPARSPRAKVIRAGR
jgi:AraC-like DNA-binding protein